MTGKRFNCKFGKHMVLEYNFYDKSKKLTFNDVVVLLNEQHETIQRLKQNIDELSSINVEEELLKENEQLKSEFKALRKKYNDFSDAVDKRLQEMNERLLE